MEYQMKHFNKFAATTFITIIALQISAMPAQEGAHTEFIQQFAFTNNNQQSVDLNPAHTIDLADKVAQLPEPTRGTLTTEENRTFTYTHFAAEQGGIQDNVIVLALGKGAPFEYKIPFINEYLHLGYDVVEFDFEWQMPAPGLDKFSRIFSPVQRYFEHNHQEIQTLVKHIRATYAYKNIIGHSECYSGFMFAKAQALSDQKLFDLIILDSPILSMKKAIMTFIQNPALCSDPNAGNSPDWVKSVLSCPILVEPIKALVHVCNKDYDVHEFMKAVSVPMLFIRGDKEPVVSDDEFYEMWNQISLEKVWLLRTPYHHSNSFKYCKEVDGLNRKIYLHAVQTFVSHYTKTDLS